MWPGDDPEEITDEDRKLFAEELGIDPESLSSDQSPLNIFSKQVKEEIASFLKDEFRSSESNLPVDPSEVNQKNDAPEKSSGLNNELWSDLAIQTIHLAMRIPWSELQIPPLARCLERNQQQLDLLVESANRPEWYSPSLSLLHGKRWTVTSGGIPLLDDCRMAARMLSCRAMYHLGSHRYDKAWRDILAIHCFSRQLTQDAFSSTQFVAIAVAGLAHGHTQTMLDHSDLPPDLARQIVSDLLELNTFNSLARRLKRSNRLFVLETILQLSVKGYGLSVFATGWDEGNWLLTALDFGSIDLNDVLRHLNNFYDATAPVVDHTTALQREDTLKRVKEKLALSTQQPGIVELQASFVSQSVRSTLAGKEIGRYIVQDLMQFLNIQDRVNTNLELTRLAAALAVYRAEEGTYPESLDALVPDILESLPVDYFQERPFLYRRTEEGYLLYSCGANGKDDGGSNKQSSTLRGYRIGWDYDDQAKALLADQFTEPITSDLIPDEADDLSLRLPVARKEFPKPPATTNWE